MKLDNVGLIRFMPIERGLMMKFLLWDHIDTGISKKFLQREYEKAERQEVTSNCRISCSVVVLLF